MTLLSAEISGFPLSLLSLLFVVMGPESCFLCRLPSTLSCEECGTSSCSSAHAEVHCPKDGCGCLPIRIEFREGVGNCGIATTDIKPGETVLLDTPAVWGPNLKSNPKCLDCLAPWNGTLCVECQFPVCGVECANGRHHRQECGVLARLEGNYTFNSGETSNLALSLVNVIRFLRLPITDPEKAERTKLLMDHVEDIVQNEELYNMWKVAAIEPLVKKLPNSPYTEEDVLHAIGVLQTNTVAIGVPGYNQGHALYPTFSFLSHSCLPVSNNLILFPPPNLVSVNEGGVKSLKEEEEWTTLPSS